MSMNYPNNTDLTFLVGNQKAGGIQLRKFHRGVNIPLIGEH